MRAIGFLIDNLSLTRIDHYSGGILAGRGTPWRVVTVNSLAPLDSTVPGVLGWRRVGRGKPVRGARRRKPGAAPATVRGETAA